MSEKIIAVAFARLSGPLNIVPGGSNGSVVIQYMPPGRQKIAPFVNGEPFEMEIDVTPAYAQCFESANRILLAKATAGQGDEPFTDFNHEDGAASSRPQRYFWGGDDPKTGGVLLETRLTASGKAAITKNGDTEPDFTRFSPQWAFHKKTFEPIGLPVNQGGFVNRAAFKNISKLPIVSAASGEWIIARADAADGDPDGDGDTDSPEEMSAVAHKLSSKAMMADEDGGFNAHSAAYQAHKKAEEAHGAAGNKPESEMHGAMAEHHKSKAKEFAKQALAASGEAVSSDNNNNNQNQTMTDQEIAAAVAKAFAAPDVQTAITKVVETATKPLADKITNLETERQNMAKASAKSAVQVHVARGAIAPEDTKTIEMFESLYLANAAGAETIMSKLPGKKPQRIITRPNDGGTTTATAATDPEGVILARAKEMVDKKQFDTIGAAVESIMKSADGRALYQQFRDDLVTGAAKDRLPQAEIAAK